MYYTNDASDIDRNTLKSPQLGDDHPADYKPDPGLVDAVNVALVLNRPLLLTGDPGTGKTQLAFSVAWQLAGRKHMNVTSTRVERFEAKSTSVARDLFYSFDTLRRFQASNTGGSTNNLDYITYNALGRALLDALPQEQARPYLPEGLQHSGPTRSVVLIDEIDKAPRDFPNDLLNEIDQMFFRISELGNARLGGPEMLRLEYWPLVFISSNSEKNLPDPFLRRCIYYNIPFPDRPGLHAILLARLKTLLPNGGKLMEEALDFFNELRKNNVAGRKISPAELVQWLTFMLKGGAQANHSLKDAAALAQAGLGSLSKDPEDQNRLRAALTSRLGVT
jgi:MoxR-like ATPase